LRLFPRFPRPLLLRTTLPALLACAFSAGAFAAPVPPPTPVAGLALPPLTAPEGGERLGERSRELLASLLAGESPAARERQTVHWLGILVEFSDRQFPDEYEEVFDPLGVLGVPDSVVVTARDDWFLNLMRRVDDYYGSISGGQVVLEIALADSLVSLPGTMLSYGDDELGWVPGVHLMAGDVVAAVDSVVDFSAYDLVTLIHAGPGQESDLLRDSPELIWSGYVDHEALTETFADSIPPDSLLGIFPGIPTADQDSSFVLQRFSVAPELELEEQLDPPFVLGALGVYVHQLGGYLGLLSLNDYLEPRAQGAGNFDLMSSGLWNALGFVPGPPSAFNRMLLGWAEPLVISREECAAPGEFGGQSLRLQSFERTGADSILLRFPISDREYFLAENRNQDADGSGSFTFSDDNGNHVPDNAESLAGAEFDYFTTQYNSSDTQPGSGLFLWRIDEELIHLTFLTGTNLINAYNEHYGVMLLEADGYPDLSTPGYYDDSYGGDYDAFRAAGGAAALPMTQTALGVETLPSTRSAEGADTGWSFHSIGVHDSIMDLVARWDPDTWRTESLLLRRYHPAGDPLVADLTAGGGPAVPEFVFAATNGADSSFVFAFRGDSTLADPDGNPATHDPLAAVFGLPAGSPAAGDLTGDGLDDVVLLTRDGRLFAWDGAGASLAPGPDPWLAELDSALTTPLLHDLDESLPGLEILLAEILPGGDRATDSTRLRCFAVDGSEILPTGADSLAWATPHAGLPAGDLVLGLAVAPDERGPEHPAPGHAFFHVALVDTTGAGSGAILRLAAPDTPDWAAPWAGRVLAFTPSGDAAMSLAAGDLDGDGTDELIVEAEGEVWLWYPEGRYGGDYEGETLLRSPHAGAGANASLLSADLDGNGSLEALALESDGASAFGADAALVYGWPSAIAQTNPLPGSYSDPAVWGLALRDAGGDELWTFTRDGRLFPGRGALAEGDPLWIGGNLAGHPALLYREDQETLGIHGLSFFESVEGNSSPEDELLTEPLLRYWWSEESWQGDPELQALGWSQGGANARRSRRAAAAGPLTLPGAGTARFLEAYPYPNPAGESVTWRVRSDSPDRFEIKIFDLEGQLRILRTGATDGFSAWEGQSQLVGLAPGVYFYSILSEASGRLATGRLAVLR